MATGLYEVFALLNIIINVVRDRWQVDVDCLLKFNGFLVSKLQSLVIWSLWVVAYPASARVNV